MRRKVRRWEAASEDDPLAGLVNLFDLWMVFSIALLLALVSASRTPDVRSAAAPEPATTEVTPSEQQTRLDQFRVSHEKLKGEGQRLGTAYRLKSGEVVYVPD
ncbi:DUF2149 domain-containing protein [Schlesneria sp. DSM 10557]|uniref:DUF2149 domain-containing protein n=1 Tax=Schlesneria sp. DSM 10557 TaxID=3044399 RepID=UPI0035A086B5